MATSFSAWRNVTADTLISRNPCLLHAVVVLADSGGGGITVYEGQDATSGDKIVRVQGSADVSKLFRFNPPLPCQRGLYVGDASHLDEVLIHYTQLAKATIFNE